MKNKSTQAAPEDPDSSSRPRSLQVTLSLRVRPVPAGLRRFLVPAFAKVARQAGVTAGQITLAVIGDKEMSRLHQQFMGDPSPTDVLTFDLRETPAGPLEVDLALCLDEATRQATSRGHQVQFELLLYAVHGLLHLLGHDDQSPAQARRMHQREAQLLQAAGFPSVYR